MTIESWLQLATLMAVVSPAIAFGIVASASWVGHPFAERAVVAVVASAFTLALVCVLSAAGWMAASGTTEVRVPLGDWFSVGHHGFELTLVLDRLLL